MRNPGTAAFSPETGALRALSRAVSLVPSPGATFSKPDSVSDNNNLAEESGQRPKILSKTFPESTLPVSPEGAHWNRAEEGVFAQAVGSILQRRCQAEDLAVKEKKSSAFAA